MAPIQPKGSNSLWDDGFEWLLGSQSKPTRAELDQANVVLQQYRGKKLAELSHESLLSVARALRHRSFESFFDGYEQGEDCLSALRDSVQIKVEEKLILRRYAITPLSALPKNELLKYASAIYSLLKAFFGSSSVAKDINFVV